MPFPLRRHRLGKGGSGMAHEEKTPALTVEIERQEWYLTLQGEPVVRCVLTRPVCAGTWRGLRAINHFYSRAAALTRRDWEREAYLRACLALADCRAGGRVFRPWAVELDTCVTYVGEGLLSLWQERRERRSPDEPPLAVRRGDTWSLSDGAPQTLYDCAQKRGWRKRAMDQIADEARRRLAGGESLLDADCVPKLTRLFDPERFYLTEEGVEVFYPMCTVAPAGEGIPAFTIPQEEET